MADRFPDQVAETLGQFEVVSRSPADGGTKPVAVPPRTGVLRLRDNAVELEVSPSLNPMVSWTQQEPGSWSGRPPEERITDGAVILGAIARQPGDVSLWGLRSVSGHLLGLPSPQEEGQRSREVLAAEWCLVGALLPSDETQFNTVELDVTGLHSFAGTRGVRVEMSKGQRTRISFVYDQPDAVIGTTATPTPGEVRFDAEAMLPVVPGPDIRLTTGTRLVMSFEGAVPLPVVVDDVANPITSLLTILHGADCRTRRLSVSTPDGKSADVYGHMVDLAAPRHAAGDVLITMAKAGGADFVGRWLDLAKRTYPVPQILAAANSEEFATVEAEALSLCTAAETLHRRLNPDERRWTADDVEDARSVLEEATMPNEIRKVLRQALSQYLFEPSFPMRIEALATRVSAVLPSCVGRVNLWKNEMTTHRHALAHGLPPQGSGIDLRVMHAISRSLRWVLTVCLLLEAGAAPEQVAESTQKNNRYQRDRRNWCQVCPTVFVNPV